MQEVVESELTVMLPRTKVGVRRLHTKAKMLDAFMMMNFIFCSDSVFDGKSTDIETLPGWETRTGVLNKSLLDFARSMQTMMWMEAWLFSHILNYSPHWLHDL